MAKKTEVLNDPEYDQYIMIAIIQASRDVVVEAATTPLTDARKAFARNILSNPEAYVAVFRPLTIVNLDTTGWTPGQSETIKIAAVKAVIVNTFNEAGNLYT